MAAVRPFPSSKLTKSNGSDSRDETALPRSVKRQLDDLETAGSAPSKKARIEDMPFGGHSHGHPPSNRHDESRETTTEGKQLELNDVLSNSMESSHATETPHEDPETPQWQGQAHLREHWEADDSFSIDSYHLEHETPTKGPRSHRQNLPTDSFDSARAGYPVSAPIQILQAASAYADVCQVVLAINDHKARCKSSLGNPYCTKHIISFKASFEEAREKLLALVGCRCSRCFNYSALKTPLRDRREPLSSISTPLSYLTPEPSRSPPNANAERSSSATTPKIRVEITQPSPPTPTRSHLPHCLSRTPKTSPRKWAYATQTLSMEAKFDTPRGPYYFFDRPPREHLFKNTMFVDEAFRNQFAQNQLPPPKWIAEVSTGTLGDEVDQMCGLPFDQSPVLGRREDVKGNTFWDTEDDRPFTWEAQKGRLELMRRASDLQMRYSDLKLEMGTMTRHDWELKAELHEHNQMWDLGARSVVLRKLQSLSLSEELGIRDGQEELPSEFILSEDFGPPSTVFSKPSLDSDE